MAAIQWIYRGEISVLESGWKKNRLVYRDKEINCS
jgi:hypothetical protein